MPTTIEPDNQLLGGLYGKAAKEQLIFPLKHTEVLAKIAGNLSRVEVTQTFENPFSEPLEAVYSFPMPDEAAVDDMEIKIGDRTIKGNIKKRSEVQQIFSQARSRERIVGSLEQQRDNVFTQSLTNIRPGEQIDVTIRYTDSLKFTSGDYEFIFPMVARPRFIPGTPIDSSGNTNLVPDAPQISPPVMPPKTRSGHDIRVTVEIEAGMPVSDVCSPSHQLQIERESVVRVKLDEQDTIPNKDLILRYRVAGNETQATVLTQCDQRGGHFAIYLIPALKYCTDEIIPKDVIFLVDTSGSQSGDPLHQSQELMRRFISGLNPDDTFTVIDFADTTKALSPIPLPNTPQNRIRAINYINQLQADGYADLLQGIRTVLDFPAALNNRLRSIILLSDGDIANENEVLSEIQQRLQPGNRLYSFGVGVGSVNRFFLNRIAEIGRGTAPIIRQDEPTEEVAQKFCDQINNPVLTNIQLSWEGTLDAPSMYPSTPPDLFAEQPLVLFGRIPLTEEGRSSEKKLCITGMTASGKYYVQTLNLNFTQTGHRAVAQLWGRDRIKDCMNQMFGHEGKAKIEAVTDIALTYQLLSQYTAFVAVTDDVQGEPDGKRRMVEVPIQLLEGVSYEGVFGDALNLPTAVVKKFGHDKYIKYINHNRYEYIIGTSLVKESENSSGYRPIEGVSTDVAGFIGFTEDIRNRAEIGKAMLVTNWTQYCDYFARPNSDGYTDFDAYLPHAVYGWFLNGGVCCYVTSLGTQLPGTDRPTRLQIARVQIPQHHNYPSLYFSLCAEQVGLDVIQIVIGDSSSRFLLEGTQGEPPANTGEYFSVQLRRGDEVLEQYDHLTMNPTPPGQLAMYVVEALRNSMYVQVADEDPKLIPFLACRPINGQYELPSPSVATTLDQFCSDFEGSQDDRTGVRGLFEFDEITMLACPDLMRVYEAGIMNRDQLHGMMNMMITACESSLSGIVPNRMVVLDPPHDRPRPQQVLNWFQEFNRRSMFAAAYYPWIKVRDPRNHGRPISVPPCGHMMGVWARNDEERGVHKTPANIVTRGVIGLDYEVNNCEQKLLNPSGINCIRRFPNRDIRVWGGHTLVEPDCTVWRYISVRRLISYIEKSIQQGTQWAVFEPNDHRLWGKIRRTTTNFLVRLWRQGALVGATPEEAFFVKCDEENNTQEDKKLGHVYIDVKVAPVRPAEFVGFRISQMNCWDDLSRWPESNIR